MYRRKAPCTAALIVVNVVVFIFLSFGGMTEDAYYMLQNGAMYLPLLQQGEYYRMFTSIFLHFGFSHLVNNMLMLGVMGWQLELVIGRIKFLIIYFAAGLGALEMDDSLSTTASSRCESFVAGGPFDHSGMVTASEICARGPIGSAAAVCEAWKNSPDHYANIVSDQFTKMGVGCWFCSTDQGQYTYWVVTFE